MPRVPQAPPPGVVRNGTPAATPGRWWDANNVRFRGGLAQPVGGNAQLPNSVVDSPPRDLLCWRDNARNRWAAFGTDTKLYAYDFQKEITYDITPVGVGALDPPGAAVGYGLGTYSYETYGTARDPADIGVIDIAANQGDQWVMDTWGQDLLVVPTQSGTLFRWSPTTPTTKAAVVAGAPTQCRGVIVTNQRSAVLWGAGGDPRNIAWSDQEDVNTWTPTVSNIAGSLPMQTQAYAMCAVKVTQGILIFSQNEPHLLNYVGPPYGYGLSRQGSGCGPISRRAVVSTGSNAVWCGMQNFWQWGGNVSAVSCDVQDWFFSLINRAMVGRIFGSPNQQFSELWWDWPGEDATECNRYVVVNVGEGTHPWSIGMRTRTAADQIGNMDALILGGPDPGGGALYLHEYGWLDNGTSRAAAGAIYCESGSITADSEGENRFHVLQVVHDVADAGNSIQYRFFTKEEPAGPERQVGPYPLVRTDGLVDTRFSGRDVRMRLEATVDGPWAIGRTRLLMRPGGTR